MRVCAIDIGCHNSAFCIEEFDPSKITGSTKEEIKDSVYMEGKITFIDKVDFAPDTKGAVITNKLLTNVTNYLLTILDKLEECDQILIEKQMNTKWVKNGPCIHLEHHILAILMYFFNDTKTNVEIYASKHKTKEFEKTKMDKDGRKKWTEAEAGDLLLAREDYENCEVFRGTKKDDYSDVIMMIQSFKVKLTKKLKKARKLKTEVKKRYLDDNEN
jgi:hypothetical protein